MLAEVVAAEAEVWATAVVVAAAAEEEVVERRQGREGPSVDCACEVRSCQETDDQEAVLVCPVALVQHLAIHCQEPLACNITNLSTIS